MSLVGPTLTFLSDSLVPLWFCLILILDFIIWVGLVLIFYVGVHGGPKILRVCCTPVLVFMNIYLRHGVLPLLYQFLKSLLIHFINLQGL